MPWNSKQPDLKNNPAYLEPRVTAVESSLAEKAQQSDLTTTNNNVALKADKTYTDSQLSLKRDKSVPIDTPDLSDTVKQQMTGATPINTTPYGTANGVYIPLVTYQHSRGDSEMQGNTTYHYHTGDVVGFYEQMTQYTAFNKFEGYVYADTLTSGLEWKVFVRDTNTMFDASVEIPVASGTLDSSSISHDATHSTVLKLSTPVFVPVNKYIFVLFRATAGFTNITRWSTDSASSPYRHPLVYGTTDGSWTGALSLASTGYYQGSIKLSLESDELKTYNPALHIPNGAITDTMLQNQKLSVDANTRKIFGAYIPYVSYQHSRGDTEMQGNTNYGYQNSNFVGFYEQMLVDTLFNRFDGYVYAATLSDSLDYKIFIRSSTAAFNPSTETAVASGTLDSNSISHDSGHLTSIHLSTPIFVSANQYVFVLLKASSGQTRLDTFNVNTYNDRHGFVMGYASNGTWNDNIAYGLPPGYCQAAIKLLLESDELKAYTPSQSVLQPAYDKIDQRTLPRIILPDEVVAVVGDKLQLFVRGMVESQNPYNQPYEMVSTVGNAYPRYFEYTPTVGDVGTKQLTVTVKDNQGTSIASVTSNLIVKNPIGQPSSAKNVLCVGDSLTAPMTWPQEFYRRLTQSGGSPTGLGYGNISFIGNTTFPNYPTQKAVGYGGWSWDTFMGVTGSGAAWVNSNPDKDVTDQKSVYTDTNGHNWQLETIQANQIKVIPYGGSTFTLPSSGTLTWVSGGTHHATITYTSATPDASTPFWDSTANKFSFSGFCNANGYSGIDIMYVLLGWNGLVIPNKANASDHTANIAKAQQFISQLHADYPNALVRVMGLEVPSPNGGIGANYGADSNYSYYNYLRSVNGWNLALQSMVDQSPYNSYCKYIAIAQQFDSENNFPQTTKAVNSRNTATEIQSTNSIHPDTTGYYQIADSVYRDFIRNYCS